ncbi:putative quinol monooxygenase [Paenibacillus sp. OV219]|uniref:putative quinol monooxygenase n=1 Tax=Paenibacillus sp. OV219 TaxID=1884377 RepID=UPI0008AD39A9|nr:antibiotic biosynthesis monooxygenase [Paenibacillus sp. OV219]SEN53122.1 Antibiotic biosynthesis monooxygenase [Paenibacillus sp. OV219]
MSMSTGIVAIATYRPHPGKEEQLKDIVRRHLPTLRAEGLITEMTPLHLQAEDGSILEIFEWASAEAKDAAHRSPAVREVWGVLMEVAEMTALASLAEAAQPFSNFRKLEL